VTQTASKPTSAAITIVPNYKGASYVAASNCDALFSPAEIIQWVDDGRTALCPKCEIDSVIGSASGYPITKNFLERMHSHWF
jgi:hypothetical protein